MRDFADGALLEESAIDAERGIITSEYKVRDSAGYRAVSYTHLDVYKRQTEMIECREPALQMQRLIAIMKRLRAPHGCPWDAEQTHHRSEERRVGKECTAWCQSPAL